MIRINLLPVRVAKKKESIRQQASVTGLSVVVLLLVLGMVYFSINKKVKEINEAIKTEEKNIAQLDKEIGELKNIENEKKVILEKLNIVRQLEVNKRRHIKMLYDIAVAMPERVWIEALKEAGQTVTITGFAASDDVVADFMRSLKAILGAWNVELEIVEQKEKEKMKLAGFTIRLERPK